MEKLTLHLKIITMHDNCDTKSVHDFACYHEVGHIADLAHHKRFLINLLFALGVSSFGFLFVHYWIYRDSFCNVIFWTGVQHILYNYLDKQDSYCCEHIANRLACDALLAHKKYDSILGYLTHLVYFKMYKKLLRAASGHPLIEEEIKNITHYLYTKEYVIEILKNDNELLFHSMTKPNMTWPTTQEDRLVRDKYIEKYNLNMYSKNVLVAESTITLT